MSCSRLLSVGAWRSLLQVVSMPASWSPACSDAQAHSVLRALCSLAAGHAEPLSRSAADHALLAARALHDARNCHHAASIASNARVNLISCGLWTRSRYSAWPTANLLQATHSVRTARENTAYSRSFSSSAADRDVHAQDGSPAVQVTVAWMHDPSQHKSGRTNSRMLVQSVHLAALHVHKHHIWKH